MRTLSSRASLEVFTSFLPIFLLASHVVAQAAGSLKFVDSYAALGDSYAAGIGAGQLGTGKDDGYYSRYQGAYPNVIHKTAGFNDKAEMKFLAMSGAESWKIKNEQVPKMGTPKIVTVSAGGNDVGLTKILNHCVYQWAPGISWDLTSFSTSYRCKDAIAESRGKINSSKFTQDLEDMLKAIISKMDSKGTVFWTGYAPFFNADTPDCDKVSWSIFVPAIKTLSEFKNLEIAYLKKDMRKELNELVQLVNTKIEGVIKKHSKQAVFVRYDKNVESIKGRFCEPGVKEPDWVRRLTQFYMIAHGGDVPEWLYLPGLSKRGDPAPREGSVEWEIYKAVERAQEKYKKLDIDPEFKSNIKKRNPDFTWSWNPMDMGRTIKDLIFRTFHPTVDLHKTIASEVVKAMRKKYGEKDGTVKACPNFKLETSNETPNLKEGCNLDNKDKAKEQPWIPGTDVNKRIDQACKAVPGKMNMDTSTLRWIWPVDNGDGNRVHLTMDWNTEDKNCNNKNQVIKQDDCKEYFRKTVHGCDTWTTWYKHGGRKKHNCIIYGTTIKGKPGKPAEEKKPEKATCAGPPGNLPVGFKVKRQGNRFINGGRKEEPAPFTEDQAKAAIEKFCRNNKGKQITGNSISETIRRSDKPEDGFNAVFRINALGDPECKNQKHGALDEKTCNSMLFDNIVKACNGKEKYGGSNRFDCVQYIMEVNNEHQLTCGGFSHLHKDMQRALDKKQAEEFIDKFCEDDSVTLKRPSGGFVVNPPNSEIYRTSSNLAYEISINYAMNPSACRNQPEIQVKKGGLAGECKAVLKRIVNECTSGAASEKSQGMMTVKNCYAYSIFGIQL